MKSKLVSKVRTDKERNSALDYPLLVPKANGTAVQITEGILWIRMPCRWHLIISTCIS